MKTSDLFFKNYKVSLIVSLILLVSHSSLRAQNKIVALATSENLYFVAPAICVLGLGIFLMVAFLKQKNH